MLILGNTILRIGLSSERTNVSPELSQLLSNWHNTLATSSSSNSDMTRAQIYDLNPGELCMSNDLTLSSLPYRGNLIRYISTDVPTVEGPTLLPRSPDENTDSRNVSSSLSTSFQKYESSTSSVSPFFDLKNNNYGMAIADTKTASLWEKSSWDSVAAEKIKLEEMREIEDTTHSSYRREHHMLFAIVTPQESIRELLRRLDETGLPYAFDILTLDNEEKLDFHQWDTLPYVGWDNILM